MSGSGSCRDQYDTILNDQPESTTGSVVHTAIPWKVDEVSDGVCYVVAPDIALIATLDPSDDDTPARENAQLIATAVNHHAALVEALRRIAIYDCLNEIGCKPEWPSNQQCVYCVARAALAAVGEA